MRKNIFKLLILNLLVGILLSSCDEDETLKPTVSEISPARGASNELLTLKGSDLSNIFTIVFEKGNVKAGVAPTFNTDKAILFRVPEDAVPGEQNIIITNKNGTEFTVPFNVLGFANIIDVSNYNFSAGSEITLTGKNLDDVTLVTFSGTSDEIEILSKTATTLTLKFPATALPKSSLDITNEAGLAKTTQEFVNLDEAFVIFTDDYGAGFENGSWGPAGTSTDEVKTGTNSFSATYPKGNWWADGFASWTTGVPEMSEYKTLNFWVKGGSIDLTLYITGDKREAGYGNADQTYPILIPANVWTYFKIPLSELQLWKTGSPFKQLGWWIKGPDAQTEIFYFDDVIFVK
jgi:hypothetical protein